MSCAPRLPSQDFKSSSGKRDINKQNRGRFLAAPVLFVAVSLLNVQVHIVNHERRLQAAVLFAQETYLDRLSLELGYIKGTLLVTGGLVQVGECSQRRQHCARGIEHLDLKRVKGRGGGVLSGVNVQPEGQ